MTDEQTSRQVGLLDLSDLPIRDRIVFQGNSASGNARQHNGNASYTTHNHNYHYSVRQRRSDETLREGARNRELLKAVKEAQIPRIRHLIHLGADVDYCDEDGWDALHFASGAGHADVVRIVLEAGADINSVIEYVSGDTYTALRLAVERKFAPVVRVLLDYGATMDVIGSMGCSILCIAAQRGTADIARMLIDNGASSTRVSLCWVKRAKTAFYKFPIRHHHGPDDPGSACYKQLTELLPLHIAIERGSTAIAKMLLEGEEHGEATLMRSWIAGPGEEHKWRDVIKRTPEATASCAMIAVQYSSGNTAMLDLLVQHGIDVNAQNDEGWTALHLACDLDEPEVVERLIYHGASLGTKVNTGKTVAYYAMLNGNTKCLEVLLEAGMNDGKLLHQAAQLGQGEAVKVILEGGVAIDTPFDHKTRNSTTALHRAVSEGHDAVVALLIERRASLDAVDYRGTPVMHLAARKGRLSIMKLLHNHSPNHRWGRDMKRFSVAEVAAWFGNVACMNYAISQLKTPLKIGRDHDGVMLLTRAVYMNNEEMVGRLVELGANPRKPDRHGWTPVELAEASGSKAIFNLLQSLDENLSLNEDSDSDRGPDRDDASFEDG